MGRNVLEDNHSGLLSHAVVWMSGGQVAFLGRAVDSGVEGQAGQGTQEMPLQERASRGRHCVKHGGGVPSQSLHLRPQQHSVLEEEHRTPQGRQRGPSGWGSFRDGLLRKDVEAETWRMRGRHAVWVGQVAGSVPGRGRRWEHPEVKDRERPGEGGGVRPRGRTLGFCPKWGAEECVQGRLT